MAHTAGWWGQVVCALYFASKTMIYPTLFVGIVLLLLFFGFMLLRFAFVIVKIEQESMYPTLLPGERVLCLKTYHHSWLRKGNIVLLMPKDDLPNEYKHLLTPYIKRIIGLPGDLLNISEIGHYDLYHERKEMFPDNNPEQFQVILIPEKHYFVCGDNRKNSKDSRSWGAIPFQEIQGIVVMKLKGSS